MSTSVGRGPRRGIPRDLSPTRARAAARPRDFYALLGLPPAADPRQVRERYGHEVVRAMHAGDPARAVELSAAFEGLPLAERRTIQSAGVAPRQRPPRVPRTFSLPGTLDASLPGMLGAASLLAAPHRHGGLGAVLSRLLLLIVGVALCVLVSHTVGTNVSHAFASFTAAVSSWQHAPQPVLPPH